MAVATESSPAYVIDLRTGAELALPATTAVASAMAFSPDGRWIAVGCFAGGVAIFEADTGRRVNFLASSEGIGSTEKSLRSLAYSADSSVLIGARGPRILTWRRSG